MLGEWVFARVVDRLNEPSDLYAFDGNWGVSDIEVMTANFDAVLLTNDGHVELKHSVSRLGRMKC